MKKILVCFFIVIASVMNVYNVSYADNPYSNASKKTLKQVFEEADNFVDSAGDINTTYIDKNAMKDTSRDVFNAFYMIGVLLMFIVGIILGIKYVTSGVDEKAEVKGALIVFVVGCAVIFGAITIWKVCLEVLGSF